MISRKESKKNLHYINETVFGIKVNNKIFDNFWYLNREERMRAKPYTGFIINRHTGKVIDYAPPSTLTKRPEEVSRKNSEVPEEPEPT